MDLGPDPNLMDSERCLHRESYDDHESRYRTRGVGIGRLSLLIRACIHDSNGSGYSFLFFSFLFLFFSFLFFSFPFLFFAFSLLNI